MSFFGSRARASICSSLCLAGRGITRGMATLRLILLRFVQKLHVAAWRQQVCLAFEEGFRIAGIAEVLRELGETLLEKGYPQLDM